MKRSPFSSRFFASSATFAGPSGPPRRGKQYRVTVASFYFEGIPWQLHEGLNLDTSTHLQKSFSYLNQERPTSIGPFERLGHRLVEIFYEGQENQISI